MVFIDHSKRLPSGDATNKYGLLHPDNLHLIDKGYAYWADTMAAFLAPR